MDYSMKPICKPVYTQRKHLDKKHGDALDCPSCGMPGRIDVDTPEGQPIAWPDESVWWNKYSGWECSDCHDK